jgi:hypothetical protein
LLVRQTASRSIIVREATLPDSNHNLALNAADEAISEAIKRMFINLRDGLTRNATQAVAHFEAGLRPAATAKDRAAQASA